MTDVFVLRNQHCEYLNKSLEWIKFGDSKTIFRSAHSDEAINQKVELTVKNPELRIKVVLAEQSNNSRVLVDGQDCLTKAPDSIVENDSDSAEEASNFDNSSDSPGSESEENQALELNLDAQSVGACS